MARLKSLLHTLLQVNEVKDVMVENIEKVLERGERIELLVGKADGLANQVCCMLSKDGSVSVSASVQAISWAKSAKQCITMTAPSLHQHKNGHEVRTTLPCVKFSNIQAFHPISILSLSLSLSSNLKVKPVKGSLVLEAHAQLCVPHTIAAATGSQCQAGLSIRDIAHATNEA